MNIEELLKIAESTKLPVPKEKNGYCIEGDIYNFIPLHKNKYLGTIYQKPGRKSSSISFYIEDPKVISWIDNPDNKQFSTALHGCRVKLWGTLKIYQDKIQFLCNFVEFLKNEPSFAKKIFDENENKYRDSFSKEQKQNFVDFEKANSKFIKINKIAVIANDASKGKDDFFSDQFLIDHKDIVYDNENSSLSVENIVTRIKKYTDNNDISMICIIRGGGNLYNDLFDFEDKEILDAVVAAKNKGKFILCGIGHYSDKLTIFQLADIRANTPTDAGKLVKNFLQKRTLVRDLECKNTDLKRKNENLKDKNKELTNKLENNNKQNLSQLIEKDAQINVLKNDNDVLKNDNDALKNDNDALKNDNDALKNQLNNRKNETNKQIHNLKLICMFLAIALIGIICFIAYKYFFR